MSWLACESPVRGCQDEGAVIFWRRLAEWSPRPGDGEDIEEQKQLKEWAGRWRGKREGNRRSSKDGDRGGDEERQGCGRGSDCAEGC